ncbi:MULTISPECIES: ABC-type transport auxiliary lipoprotein family protein [unclassified Sphingomonas]|uniref:ABC-type transport auxiliary lipoprotein family protein n=1 Tax=unclassified Sphingomonas TaxID=196159 RepID=UPI0006F34F27|nr:MULTISPECIES: ABC-type transport auxiliary lipoprotein family protein [unclassified Sphingomonas]KQX25353.1 ABC transporter [Sphingomonas sp. Root1294]KQY66346.1 ABC transporter [Sphingomonas sp. Root50]KRB90340.1 ABC transporter [Sphingomonas sp. Root720]
MLRRSLIALTAAGLLTGCISLGGDPPERLMSLTPTARIAAGAGKVTRDTQAISVAPPALPSALRNQRIAVQTGAAFAYLPKAGWVDTPAMLFRSVLAETIEAKTGRFVPDQRNGAITPDTRLGGTLAAFQLLGGQGKVLVIFDATIAKSGSDEIRTHRFEATVPVAGEDAPSVAAALNEAANGIAGDVADWIGTN